MSYLSLPTLELVRGFPYLLLTGTKIFYEPATNLCKVMTYTNEETRFSVPVKKSCKTSCSLRSFLLPLVTGELTITALLPTATSFVSPST